MQDRFPRFGVLELPPLGKRRTWVYATCGMSSFERSGDIEVHLHAPTQAAAHIETLTVVAHYHLTGSVLGLGHTVNLGRPWLEGSQCDHALVSLPYLDGPELERFDFDGWSARCLWLVPVTKREVSYKAQHGLEALERQFEAKRLDYANPARQSVI